MIGDILLWIDFTNFIRQSDVKKLADADEQEVVREVQVSTFQQFEVMSLKQLC
jgi:hypothetical protein